MKNKEKFAKELIDFALKNVNLGLKDGKPIPCITLHCSDCDRHGKLCTDLVEWGEQEYIEPPKIDWSKVAVDTQILVKDFGETWLKRYFAKYENGLVYAWREGRTSWNADGDTTTWKYAKLAEPQKTDD